MFFFKHLRGLHVHEVPILFFKLILFRLELYILLICELLYI